MRDLNRIEQQFVSGGEVDISFNVPIDPNAEFNFTAGFKAGIDMVGGVLGFAIGVPLAFVVLPIRGVYSVYQYVNGKG